MKNNSPFVPETIYDGDELDSQILTFLDDDVVNTVLILSDEICYFASENKDFEKQLLMADILLPSSPLMMKEFLKLKELSVEDYDAYEYNSFEKVMKVVSENASTSYILTDSEKELERCKIMMKMDAPNISSWEKCVDSIEMANDTILNEINSIVPDVLICSLESPLQEKWIMDNKDKMNAKMILAIGPDVKKAKKNKASIREKLRVLLKK